MKDEEILEEIGDLYSKDEQTTSIAVDAFKHLTNVVNPKHGEGWHKLADLLMSSDRNGAIECYKQAIELVEGEGVRSKIALTLQELLIAAGDGREDEIEPYRKYLN